MRILATVLCLCIAAGAVSAQDSTVQVKEYPHLYLLAGSLVGAIAFTRAWDSMVEYHNRAKAYENIEHSKQFEDYQFKSDFARMIMVGSGVTAAVLTYYALQPRTHRINLTMAGDLTAPKLCLSYRF